MEMCLETQKVISAALPPIKEWNVIISEAAVADNYALITQKYKTFVLK